MADEWFYARDGEQVGPMGVEALQRLAGNGELGPDDFVWREGLPVWVPAAELPELAAQFAAGESTAPYDTAAPPQYTQAPYAQPVEALGYAQPQIGYYTPPRMAPYAGFWWRFLAAFVDGIIVAVVNAVIGFMIGFAFGTAGGRDAAVVAELLASVSNLIVAWLYEALQESSVHQATLGKRLCGLVVTDMNGQRISFGRATGRHFAKILSALILLIGYIMQAFTERRQALHDMLAGTLVLKPR